MTCFLYFFLSFFFWCDNFHIGIQSNLSKNIQNHKHRVQCHSDLKQVFCSPQRRWVTLHLAASLTCTVEFTVWFPVKGRKKKKRENVSMQACDKSSNQTHISSAPICGNLVMFSPPQHHEHSGKNWRCAQYIFILLHIIIECLQASTTEYDTHVF